MTTASGTLDGGFRRSVGAHGSRVAVRSDPRTLTYRELDAAVDDAVGWLLQRGVQPGDRILLQLDKGLAFLVLHLANMRFGSVTVPLNPGATHDEVVQAATDCRPRLLVRGTNAHDGDPPEVEGVPEVVAVMPDSLPAGDSRRTARQTPPSPRPDDLACLLYTSGTTGRPKGARLLHRHLAANARTLADAWGWTPEDRLLHVLPLFHVHGLFVAASVALDCGAGIELRPRFDAPAIWDALLTGDITIFMGVPTMYHRLLAAAPRALPRPVPVRLFTSGSAPLRVETLQAFEELTGHVILERYGMTEVGMAASNPLHGTRKAGSVGPALPGVGLRVSHPDNGEAQVAGDVGEVQISGPSVFDGYWERPEQTAASFTADGWLRSGDLGFLDDEGYLHLVGRAKELIISGGLNVYPREVESVLDEHPAVLECAVCGVPDDDFGEVVAAGVVRAPDATCTPDGLLSWARERLAAYKLPKRVVFLPELPRNAMGKVRRDQLAGHPGLRSTQG